MARNNANLTNRLLDRKGREEAESGLERQRLVRCLSELGLTATSSLEDGAAGRALAMEREPGFRPMKGRR